MKKQICIEKKINKNCANLKKRGYETVSSVLMDDFVQMHRKDSFNEGLVLIGGCAVIPVLSHLHVKKLDSAHEFLCDSGSMRFASKKISHILKQGAVSFPLDWVDYIQEGSVIVPAFSVKRSVNVRVPDPCKFALSVLAIIATSADPEEVRSLSIMAKFVLHVLNLDVEKFSKVTMNAPVNFLENASKGVVRSIEIADCFASRT